MKPILFITLFYILVFSCKEETSKTIAQEAPIKEEVAETSSFELPIFTFKEFESFLNKKDDKTYVINFWATWCAPCIKELPYFEEVNKQYESKNVEVILVSLDFPRQYEKKLIPFIKKRKLKSKVIALNDTKMNDWIPKVNESWSGAIPATVIYNKDKSEFYERSFTLEELEDELQQFITH